MDNVEISRPHGKDTPLIHAFFKAVLLDTFEKNGIAHLSEDLAAEIADKEKYLQQDLESGGQDRYFLIAKHEGKIIGSIEYGPAGSLIISCTEGRYAGMAEVGTVFVHPDYQKQGLGSRLLKQLVTEMRSRGLEEFCLDSGYGTAQEIWTRKLGFPAYHLKDFWAEGADHMVWRVRIDTLLNPQ